ncbi:MAG: hypothetical protein PHT15_04855, partial [Gallionellaceae bacterium]|nr:hypothetical protein [Gallionellaceae bacterium]
MSKANGENLARLIAAGQVSRVNGFLNVIVSDELGFTTQDIPAAADRMWGFFGDDNWERMEEEALRFDIPTDEFWGVAEPALT